MVLRLGSFAFATAFLTGVVFMLPSDVQSAPSSGSAEAARGAATGRDHPPNWLSGERVEGPARIVDGDTIDIGGTRIRLEGIDAPEAGQDCERADGTRWRCGDEATRLLSVLVRGAAVSCIVKGLDKYGRTLATCYSGTIDINGQMVRQGFAWAFVKYSATYVKEEAAARASRAGVWQGHATPPWVHRETRWTSASESAPQGCAIKGNVSHSGRIYHMPWSPWYGKVVMRSEKGTRWFCSEAEAQAAGWRPANAR